MGCGSFAPSDGADYRLSDIDFIVFSVSAKGGLSSLWYWFYIVRR